MDAASRPLHPYGKKMSVMQPHSPEAGRPIAQQEHEHESRAAPEAPPSPRTPPSAMSMATLFVAMVVMVAVLL